MTDSDRTRRRAEMPEGVERVLNVRSLAVAYPRLAALLKPGMRVLDVGCGTGAMTGDMAQTAGRKGLAVGADINARLMRQARQRHDHPVRFVQADIYDLPFHPVFDLTTAARALQWLARPYAAILALRQVTRPGGTVALLDYNHEKIRWEPDPPATMTVFYEAFLRWRSEAGMDNTIADHLSVWCEQAGLLDIRITPQHEITNRQDVQFSILMGLWAEVAATRGRQMVSEGFITEKLRRNAERDYRAWVKTAAQSQKLYLLSVEGRAPASL